uniref:Ribosomal protein S21 n=1 Tax=Cladonia uncialis subsp. uncialis TaxID=180999 RepID=A0A1Z1CCL4_CLAUC|nr:hypothetical protein [Cladonia uncialis subsp. uncialis]
MELRRLGDPILRPRATPLLSFLAPSVSQSWWLIAGSRSARSYLANTPRNSNSSFHTTACRSAESPPSPADIEKPQKNLSKPKASTTADLSFLKKPQKNSSNAPPDSSFSRRFAVDQNVARILDQTLDSLPNPAKREPSTPNIQSSADRTRKALGSYLERERGARTPGQVAQSMDFPRPADPQSNPSASLLNSIKLKPAVRAKRTVRSRPTVGRTIEVYQEGGQHVAGALKKLEILCVVNKIRSDQFRQRFHERPGLKRKRLKSERWRKLFKASFKTTVARVQEMRRKGW